MVFAAKLYSSEAPYSRGTMNALAPELVRHELNTLLFTVEAFKASFLAYHQNLQIADSTAARDFAEYEKSGYTHIPFYVRRTFELLFPD